MDIARTALVYDNYVLCQGAIIANGYASSDFMGTGHTPSGY